MARIVHKLRYAGWAEAPDRVRRTRTDVDGTRVEERSLLSAFYLRNLLT